MGLKRIIRNLTPRWLLSGYHWLLSSTAALWYGFPAKHLVVVGVTGTKGKSTVSAMVWHVLTAQGKRCALFSTVQFAYGPQAELNAMKMTMPSPFILQSMLRHAVREGCTHAVVETSSEGLAQWRHIGIPYAVAVLTNLTPEHIEAHGSYENYRAAKGRLFRAVREGAAVINMDDGEAPYFTAFPVRRRIGYTLGGASALDSFEILRAHAGAVHSRSAEVQFNGVPCRLPVGGFFNIMNAAAAFGAALVLGLEPQAIARALSSFPGTPGRMEYIGSGQPFNVIVDYAHTAESLEALYQTLRLDGDIVAVLGATGGGRDKQKRVPMGQVAGKYARAVFVTDEDPYDEDPRTIMEAVAQGARQAGKQEGYALFVEPDRRRAIAQAIRLARNGDTVAITGKGAEQCIMRQGGQREPWDDRRVAQEELGRIGLGYGKPVDSQGIKKG